MGTQLSRITLPVVKKVTVTYVSWLDYSGTQEVYVKLSFLSETGPLWGGARSFGWASVRVFCFRTVVTGCVGRHVRNRTKERPESLRLAGID